MSSLVVPPHNQGPELERRIRELGDWFHNLNLGGIQTAPNHYLGDYPRVKWEKFAHAVPSDLTGKSVLDIGCNAGFYSIEMKRRGADRVVGIDWDEAYLAQARFAAEVSGADGASGRGLSIFGNRDLRTTRVPEDAFRREPLLRRSHELVDSQRAVRGR